MTTVAEFFAPGVDERQKIKRDRWGRYLLPHPDTQQEQAWTRVTTLAKACADTYGLERWAKRMVAIGMAQREDFQIAVLAAADNEELDRVVELAKEHAGGSIGSRHGTAMHSLSERVDRGETFTVSPVVQRDLDAYRAAITDFAVEYIERIVVLPSMNVAGTLDRIVRLPDGRLMVLDLKTGADLSYAWVEIAAQLNLYANAPLMWNPEGGTYEPMPEVDKTTALVLHLPKGEGTAKLYAVDIAAADEVVFLCTEVRRVQRLKGLAREVTADDLRTTVDALAASVPQPDAKPGTVTLGGGGTPSAVNPPEGTAQVISLRSNYPLNPAPDPGFLATPDDVAALMNLIGETPPDKRARLVAWSQEATAAERPFDQAPLTQRCWTVMRAGLICALHAFDWQVQIGLGRVLGAEIPADWSLGATLGSLNEAQADQLATLVMSGELDPF